MRKKLVSALSGLGVGRVLFWRRGALSLFAAPLMGLVAPAPFIRKNPRPKRHLHIVKKRLSLTERRQQRKYRARNRQKKKQQQQQKTERFAPQQDGKTKKARYQRGSRKNR